MKIIKPYGLVALSQIALLGITTGMAILPAIPSHAQNKPAQTTPFAAASATWMKIEMSATELDKTIRAGKLSEVHEVAFAIRDDVVTLPGKSAALSADKKKKLAGYVNTISSTASALDEAGDSNNAKAVKVGQARMKSTLKSIKDLYPAGTLKPMSGSKMSPMKDTKMGDMKGMKM